MVGAGIAGHHDRPLPALVAGQVGEESVGGAGRDLRSRRRGTRRRCRHRCARRSRRGPARRRQSAPSPIRATTPSGRRSRLRGRSGHVVRCFHGPPILPHSCDAWPHRSPAHAPQPAWGRIDVCLDGAVITRMRAESRPPAAWPQRPGGRASRHGQLPGRRPGLPRGRRRSRRRCPAPIGTCRRWTASRAPSRRREPPPRRSGSRRAGHRHPCRRAAQPRDGFADVLAWCTGPPPPTAPTSPG